ncbi:hypothetical protein [Chitinivorax sp. B]|uniref:hypothetical protein n=1 Tax=Chitinivorax sp. B TaxID=2502235 RepID=UPI0010F72DAA|nr:hypothetical protein [Chitinivorax sp. B]
MIIWLAISLPVSTAAAGSFGMCQSIGMAQPDNVEAEHGTHCQDQQATKLTTCDQCNWCQQVASDDSVSPLPILGMVAPLAFLSILFAPDGVLFRPFRPPSF